MLSPFELTWKNPKTPIKLFGFTAPTSTTLRDAKDVVNDIMIMFFFRPARHPDEETQDLLRNFRKYSSDFGPKYLKEFVEEDDLAKKFTRFKFDIKENFDDFVQEFGNFFGNGIRSGSAKRSEISKYKALGRAIPLGGFVDNLLKGLASVTGLEIKDFTKDLMEKVKVVLDSVKDKVVTNAQKLGTEVQTANKRILNVNGIGIHTSTAEFSVKTRFPASVANGRCSCSYPISWILILDGLHFF